jgi:hypothetical protein
LEPFSSHTERFVWCLAALFSPKKGQK